jgi:uncharacterized protein YndB with AHSA1/START domain
MPVIELEAACAAAPEEVWKLLHDPARFPDWWAGLARVDGEGDGTTFYRSAWPDFPYPTHVAHGSDGRSIVVSCQISDIDHEWTLAPGEGGGCRIAVRVVCPDEQADRLEEVRAETAASLPRLVALAEGDQPGEI